MHGETVKLSVIRLLAHIRLSCRYS